MKPFDVIIVEDVRLEMKGTEEIFRTEIPEAHIIGTAMNEDEFWKLMAVQVPQLVMLDLGLGGSPTVGVDICRQARRRYPALKIMIFTGETQNERLWADVLQAGADGLIVKSGELFTRSHVEQVMSGTGMVFNTPVMQRVVERYVQSVQQERLRRQAVLDYAIDEYDERLLRHLALGYTKEMITNLRGMPFGVKSLEKRQNDLVLRLFGDAVRGGVNATRLVVRALQLHIIDLDNLEADED